MILMLKEFWCLCPLPSIVVSLPYCKLSYAYLFHDSREIDCVCIMNYSTCCK